MNPLTEADAWALLGKAFGLRPSGSLGRCRVNFFESGRVGIFPDGVLLVRQDMLGRRQAHRFRPWDLEEVEVLHPERPGRALRFRVSGVRWQLDRMDAATFEALADLLAGGAALRSPPGALAAGEPDGPSPLAADSGPEPTTWPGDAPASSAARPGEALASSAARPGEALASSAVPVTTSVAAATAPAQASSSLPRPPASSSGPRRTPVDELLDGLEKLAAGAPSAEELAPLIRRIFHQSQRLEQTDRALLAAQSLLALGKAGPQERRLAERYESSRLLQAVHPLTAEQVQALRPMVAADVALMHVARACIPALVRMTARPPGDYGLGGPPEGAEQLAFGRVFAEVRRMLGLERISYHPAPDGPDGMRFANLVYQGQSLPTLVVGRDFLSGRSELELGFWVANELAFLWPEHLLRVLVPDLPQQAVIILTAVAMTEPDQPLPSGQEQAIRSQLSHMSRYMELEDFETVSRAVRALLSQPEPFDLARWNRAVERTALRVGLLVCGDARVALRCVASLHLPPAQHRIARAELLRFALGELHQRLRAELGLSVA